MRSCLRLVIFHATCNVAVGVNARPLMKDLVLS